MSDCFNQRTQYDICLPNSYFTTFYKPICKFASYYYYYYEDECVCYILYYLVVLLCFSDFIGIIRPFKHIFLIFLLPVLMSFQIIVDVLDFYYLPILQSLYFIIFIYTDLAISLRKQIIQIIGQQTLNISEDQHMESYKNNNANNPNSSNLNSHSQTNTQNYPFKNISKDKQQINKTSNIQYQTVPTLKTVGYVVGQPTVVQNRPTSSSHELLYSNGVIVHEHPSRPARSPSPAPIIHQNIVPHTNFIYPTSLPGHTTVSHSPSKIPVVSRYIQAPMIVPTVPIQHSPMIQKSANPQDYIPRSQYQRCVQQCKNWESRYNQLYLLYLKSKNQAESLALRSRSNQSSSLQKDKVVHTNLYNSSEQNDHLIRENRKLKQKLRSLQSTHQRLSTNMEDVITSLINKYRDSTLKQCLLLTDRYRLQRKINEK